MSETFNPGDILTISTASYKRRRFTVVEVNGHRTVLRGARGARRVLVLTGVDRLGAGYSIHEDDGERNRGRPCTVDLAEGKPVEGPMASVTVEPAPPPRNHYPITAMDLARLMRCETARDVAGWVFDRDVSHSCVTNDPHTTDTAAAFKLYLASLEVLRASAEAGE